MNRYFTKRKANTKKPLPAQPKFDLDLTTALPAQDDFRTSLIMNSLSARFSMLREQDDPTSMLGKASDDSVLGPRRQSRLMDFGYSPGRALHDIAEVSSIRSSIRPPFAASSRADSYFSEDGYGTDTDSTYNGSIMNRSRPGEGNSLFGGRQKIYKIPMAGATSEASIASGASMKGRVLYDDDVSMSTFQRWRKEERERLGSDRDLTGLCADDDCKNDQQSPIGGTVTRHASTSTNAASTGRTSTAATSVTSHQGAMHASNTLSMVTATSPPASIASPALDRNISKSRRLYDHVSTRDVEEQQHNPSTRLNSLQHSKISGGSPTSGRSNSRQGAAYGYATEQPLSSPPHNIYGLPTFPLTETTIPENEVSHSQPPSPPRKYSHDPLTSSINPRDRGKATAMGAFNKPQQFSEQQYLERQLTLRGGQRQPYSRGDEPAKTESRAISITEDRSASPSVYANSTYSGRSRAPTNASAQEVNISAFSVFQSAAHQMKSPKTGPSEAASEHAMDHGFDFGLDTGKIEESELFASSPFSIPPLNINSNSASRVNAPSRPTTSKSTVEFPKLESQPSAIGEQQSRYTPSAVYNSSKYDEPLQSLESLAPLNGGLSGLVRRHLRQDSAASSQYDFEERNTASRYLSNLSLATKNINTSNKGNELVTPAESNFSHLSNPFDLEDLKHATNENPRQTAEHDQAVMKQEDDVSPKAARATRRRGMSQAPDTIADIPWAQQLQKSHNRGPSNETIQEQDALTNELARRKIAIQERLRAKMEEEQAAAAAAPSIPMQEEKPLGGPFRGLEMLRTKSSRESIKKMTDSINSTKQSKLFGLPSSMAPSAERPSFQSDRFRSEEPASTYTPSLRSRSTSRPATSRSVAPPLTKPFAASGVDSTRSSADFARDRKGSNPPPIAAHNVTARSRSNSVQSNGRSRSRNGRYKDDLERAMVEGSSRVTTQIWPDAPVLPEATLPPMPSLEKLENSQRFTTDGSATHPNLKIAVNRPSMPATGYFESRGLYPPPQALNSPMSLSSTASSPMLPHHNNSPRPSPGLGHMGSLSSKASPGLYHNMATPPMSGASTPINHTFAPQTHAPPPSSFRSRSLSSKKRSVHKFEISEPRLISTTSVIDTVALPAGASLKNGMYDIQKAAPPLPAVNPLRQKFGFHPQANPSETSQFRPRHRLRKSSSEGAKLGMYLHQQSQSPAMTSNPALSSRMPRPPMEGGMF